jgi:hypothetical protein
VRRAPRRLGRLAGNTGLLALTGVVCFAAAGASAAPGPVLFRLTIAANTRQQWDHTSAPTPAGACRRSLRSEGVRTVRFRSTAPTTVRVLAGRLLPADIRGLTGTVAVAGTNTINEICEGTGTDTVEPCARTLRSFRGGRTGLVSTKAGSVTLRPIRNIRLAAVQCPLEPDDVVHAPLGPIPTPLRLSTAVLAKDRITLTASATRRTSYVQPEAGHLQERADWTLTFVRRRR